MRGVDSSLCELQIGVGRHKVISACRDKLSQEFFREVFLSFFCARKGQAYLKTLDVRLLLRFLNVLDQSCEMTVSADATSPSLAPADLLLDPLLPLPFATSFCLPRPRDTLSASSLPRGWSRFS